ncbi:MAG: hypothetical protein AAB974_02900 [Patescibacteria group bacterium]
MANVSRGAIKKAVEQSLPSSKKWMAGSLMKKAGMDPHHSASVKGYEAQRLMKKLQPQFKAGAQHLTERELGAQIKKADAPTGPSAAVVKAGKMVAMRERMDEEAKKKADITEAMSRKSTDKKSSAPAARPQTPTVGGGVIGKAAQDASHGGRAGGSFSGADRIERGGAPSAPAPSKVETPEAIDPFGED